MKASIHQQYYPDAQVSCTCGNMFTVGSTKQSIRVEICHKCHPFFTGEMKYVDTLGRVEKFQKKQKTAESMAATYVPKKKKKLLKLKEDQRPKTLREMLLGTS